MPQASSASTHGGLDTARLRALTEAVISVSAGLELSEVLQRLVSTAATLSGARYGALGISGPDGGIVEFVTHGIAESLREQLGGMPHARGLPGALLRPGAETLRLAHVTGHPASVGFPADHPPMRTFLGVPLRVSGTIFGNLYVAEKRAADGSDALFTAEDEEALLTLGAAAGVAIENARLYTAVRHRQRWSDAVGTAIHAIISRSELDTRLRLAPVAAVARTAAECDVALLACLESDGSWPVRHVDADSAHADVVARLTGTALPDLQAVRPTTGKVVELGPDDLRWLPGRWDHALVVPVSGTREITENVLILVSERAGRPALGRPERDSELAFGQRLGLALQVAQAQADQAALSLLQDRDRIARDLHDHVIQRLFAIGLSLQAAGVAARVPEVAERLARAVTDIDETIGDVRRTIFELHGGAPRAGLRHRVEDVVGELREGLPEDLEVHVSGNLDDLPAPLAVDLVPVVRETLTNVARHAGATSVRLYVTVGAELEVEVVDDGRGMPEHPHLGEGLGNLADRAAGHGGTFEVAGNPDGGTIARWAVPLT